MDLGGLFTKSILASLCDLYVIYECSTNERMSCYKILYYFSYIDIAGIPLPQNLSGYSLLPLSSETFKNEHQFKRLRPPWILSEFHGCNVNASTYMLRTDQWKYIAYSDGASVLPQLFGKCVNTFFKCSMMCNELTCIALPKRSTNHGFKSKYPLLLMLQQSTKDCTCEQISI